MELKKNHELDFERVMKEIGKATKLEVEKMTSTEHGIRQIKTGNKGSGTIQLYLTCNDRTEGNIRIQIGAKGIGRLKIVRMALLRSAWFTETTGMTDKLSEKMVKNALKDDSKFLLPSITVKSDEKAVKKNLQIVRTQVGMEARSGMKEYLEKHKIPRDHKFFETLEKIFRD